jgi:hypothetical protein
MKLLMRGDPKEALSIIGVEVSDEFEIVVTSDAESGGDTATILSEGFSNTQKFNRRGELSIESKSKSEFTSRGTNWDDIYQAWLTGGTIGNYVGVYFCGNPYTTSDRSRYVMAANTMTGETHWYGYYDICSTTTTRTVSSTTDESSTTVDDTQCEEETRATTTTTDDSQGSAGGNQRAPSLSIYVTDSDSDCGGR